MQIYIALLRGINVGGHKKLKMADLKLLFEELGFNHVVTYIQSGNVVFSAENKKGLAEKIAEAIQTKFKYDVPVLVKTASEITEILNECPFDETKKPEAYFMLLATQPKEELITATREMDYPNEEFVITQKCVYLYFANGVGNAKLNNNLFEKKLNVAATTRNYRTLTKLVILAKK